MKLYAALLPLFGLMGACATLPGASPEEQQYYLSKTKPAIASPNIINLIDSRDAKSFRSKTVSTMIWDCGYFVHVLGEDSYAQDRIPLLEQAIVDSIGPANASSVMLTIKKYDIFLNNEQVQTNEAVAVGFASVGVAASVAQPESAPPELSPDQIKISPKCGKERMKGGWFDPTDLTRNVSPITIEIEAEFNGRLLAVTSAFSPPVEINLIAPGQMRESDPLLPLVKYSLQEAMAKANDRFTAAISEDN